MSRSGTVDLALKKEGECVLLSLLREKRLLLMGLAICYKQKTFAASVAAYQDPEVVLICLFKNSISGVAAAIGIMTL